VPLPTTLPRAPDIRKSNGLITGGRISTRRIFWNAEMDLWALFRAAMVDGNCFFEAKSLKIIVRNIYTCLISYKVD
jgi:hypothetical protein